MAAESDLRQLRRELKLLRQQHVQDKANIHALLWELGYLAVRHPELQIPLRGREQKNADARASDRPVHGSGAAGETLPFVCLADLPCTESGNRPPRCVVRAERGGGADPSVPPLPQIYDGSTTWEQEALPFTQEGLTARGATNYPAAGRVTAGELP